MDDTSLDQLAPLQITDRGQPLLAFVASDKLSSLAKGSALQQADGWIVHGDEVRPWRFSGYVRRGDALLVTGPRVEGELLVTALRGAPADALAAVTRVAAALARLARAGLAGQALQLNGIMLLAGGGVLVLPPAVIRQLTETHSPAAMLAAAARVNHPDLGGEQRWSTMVAILSYRAITGEYPFPAPREEELRNQMRRLDVVPARLLAPGCSAELSSSIARALRPQRHETRPPLADWPALLARAREQAVPAAAPEAQRLQAEAAVLRHRYAQSFRRRVFLQRNLRTMVVTAVIAAAAAGVLGSIVANQFKPRVTRGYSPRQVVEAFYASIGALDHATMEDAVVGDAGKGLINEVVNLFVVSRVAQGYEGRSHIVNAAEWAAAGEPELPPDRSLYGPTALAIVAEQGAPQPVFRVSYLMWRLGGADGDDPPGTPQQGIPTSERVFLRQDKGDWVIFQFQPLEPPPSAR